MPIPSKKLLIIIIFVLLVLGAGFAGWKFWNAEKLKIKIKEENRTFEQALKKMAASDPKKILKAIPDLEKIIESPTSAAAEARAKILLAFTLLNGERRDELKNIALFKEVSSKKKYPNQWRALAIQYLAESIDSHSADFCQKFIFTGQPFEGLYKKNGNLSAAQLKFNLSVAQLKLWEWSDSLYSLAVPNYRIAQAYANSLLEDRIYRQSFLSDEQRKDNAVILNQRLQKADALFASVPMKDWDGDRLMFAYLAKAQTLGKLYLLNPASDAFRAEAETFFKKAWEIAEGRIVNDKRGFFIVPFHYAAFLAEVYGNSNDQEIKSLLDLIVDPSTNRKRGFPANYLESPEKSSKYVHYREREIIILAQIDPRFKDLLKGLGWEEKQLDITIKPLVSKYK